MKAMGAESDQEIIQLVGEEESLAMLLLPTIQDCKQKGIFTQGQALDYLGRHWTTWGRRKKHVLQGVKDNGMK